MGDSGDSWEDWLGMLLGLLVALSPWVSGDHLAGRIAVWNAALVGVLLFFLAELEYVLPRRWEEAAQLVLGLWLVVSPYVFGSSTTDHCASGIRRWAASSSCSPRLNSGRTGTATIAI